MGQFFKFLFASCLGVFIALILLFGIGTAILFGLAESADQPKDVKPNSVLHLTFDDPVPEKTNNIEVSPFELRTKSILGLQEIVRTLEEAREDDRIKGILLDLDRAPAGFVTSSVLRKALEEFQTSGKFIIAYSKYYSQGGYHLASVAEKIYLNPVGGIDFRGLAVQIPFFKDMLDRIGINMNVFYAGKFKSATEPYRRNDMSPENRQQVRAYLDDIYEDLITDISRSRNITPEELRRIAGEYLANLPEDALRLKLVDAIGYRDEAMDEIRHRLGLEEEEKVPMISLPDYNRSNPPDSDYTTRDKIAIVYAEGAIVDGKGEIGRVGDKKYTDIVQDIIRSEQTRAIVLRVNSPGGSAIASEQIWRSLQLAREEGKPVVVSMGDFAASGGYYIAVAADSILAEPNTLTGSIGVFAAFPVMSELSEDKLGIHWDTVKTAPLATLLSPFFPVSEAERRILQRNTDNFYETFLQRVADGRGMSRDSVHAIAQGRVWTGEQAVRIGLVDRLGDLEDAIGSAAALAGLEAYRVTEYPRTKEPLQQLLEDLMGMETASISYRSEQAALRRQLGQWYPYYRFLEELKDSRGVQARLPFMLPLE